MPDEFVLDASVAAKFYFFEEGSEAARALLTSDVWIAAPDLLFVEMASVCSTRVRRRLSSEERAEAAVKSTGDLVDLVVPLGDLTHRAFQLAVQHGVSAYDGSYLALAEARGLQVVTADDRLIRRATEAGLSHLVRSLRP